MKDDTIKQEKKEEIADVIQLSQRKTFRIDGDYNRQLSLDVSDMNVVTRLEEAYPKMKEAAMEAADRLANIKETSDDSNALKDVADALKGIDDKMREQIDYVFDSNVSEVCVPKGTMYDPCDGQFRFEHIIEVLSTLYANNFSKEFKSMRANVNKHTAKYTGSTRRKK